MNRIQFLRTLSMACLVILFSTCTNQKTKKATNAAESVNTPLKLSLAQWSLNRSIRGGLLDPYDFAKQAHEYGFTGLEYVTQLYKEIYNSNDKNKAIQNFVTRSNAEAKKYGLENVLIMVDGEGDLANEDEKQRLLAVENHKRWVDAAAAMGCSSIRVNLYGSSNHEKWKTVSQKSLLALSEYASASKVQILVENHGGLSSDASLLMEVINAVNTSNCGTLPDFGNFCIRKEKDVCIKEYDRYLGVKTLLPKAGAVSAKSYDFDQQGNETTIDFKKMVTLVKNAGYTGYIGVEYEGNRLSEKEGILSTKSLIETSF